MESKSTPDWVSLMVKVSSPCEMETDDSSTEGAVSSRTPISEKLVLTIPLMAVALTWKVPLLFTVQV